jgi:hypothetical protein
VYFLVLKRKKKGKMCGTCQGNTKKCCGKNKNLPGQFEFAGRKLNPPWNTPNVINQSPANSAMRANIPTSYTRVVPQQGYSNSWATSEVAEQRIGWNHIHKNVAPVAPRLPPANMSEHRYPE